MSIINNMYLLTGTIGLFFATAPFTLDYNENFSAMITSISIGLSAIIATMIEKHYVKKKTWKHWIFEMISFITLLSPLQFGLTHNMASVIMAVIFLRVYIATANIKTIKKKKYSLSYKGLSTNSFRSRLQHA